MKGIHRAAIFQKALSWRIYDLMNRSNTVTVFLCKHTINKSEDSIALISPPPSGYTTGKCRLNKNAYKL